MTSTRTSNQYGFKAPFLALSGAAMPWGDDAVGTMGRQEHPFADRNLTRKSASENTSAIPESRLELVLVIAINVVLWTIAVIEIMGAVQMTAPMIGNPVA